MIATLVIFIAMGRPARWIEPCLPMSYIPDTCTLFFLFLRHRGHSVVAIPVLPKTGAGRPY